MKFPLLLPIAFLFLILSILHSQEKWRRLTADNGLQGNKVLCIYQAKNGDIWIGTDKGINLYNGVFEGFLHRPVNSIFESSNGQLMARVKNANNFGLYFFDGLEWNDL